MNDSGGRILIHGGRHSSCAECGSEAQGVLKGICAERPNGWHDALLFDDRGPEFAINRDRRRKQIAHCQERTSGLIENAQLHEEFDRQLAAIEMLNADLWLMVSMLLEPDA